MSNLYTYRPIVMKNGAVAYLRVPVTEDTMYPGMPLLERTNVHASGGSSTPNITDRLLRNTRDAEAARQEQRHRREEEAAESSRLSKLKSVKDIIDDTNEVSVSRYVRVMDI